MPSSQSPIATGRRDKHVIVQHRGPNAANPTNPGVPTPTWIDATPRDWYVAIEPATARSLERIASGSTIAQASHVVTGPYRADIKVNDRVVYTGRPFSVIGVATPEEKQLETILLCSEVLP